MSVALRRLRSAELDLVRAAEWYDDQRPGLGEEFAEEVDEVVRSLARNPLQHSAVFADVRRVRLRRFWPYAVFYYLHQEEVIVFAIFHASRQPERLARRRSRLS
ncbi:MAG: type II toxin-antitoxin system RelE/ParE family toxin [Verrucomicrobia bacterium]|nr:type II toxin-antitoxin system RelE/ParE family toxin [Verrucomicrobiota bacterium]